MTTILPENILRLMPASERAKLGKAGKTAAECVESAALKSEKELQTLIRQWLNLQGLYFDQDAMNRRRTGTTGAPDFQFPYRGRFVAWECKAGGGRLRPDQITARDQIIAQGGEWRLIERFDQAKEHLQQIDSEAKTQPITVPQKCQS